MNEHDFNMQLRDAMPKMKVIARRWGSLFDVQDLLQETYYQACRSRDAYENTGSMVPWLTVIMRNIALMRLRSKAPASVSIDESIARLDEEETRTALDQEVERATMVMPQQENHAALFQAISRIGQLSPRQQAVMNAVVLHDMDYPEAGEKLGFSTVQLRNQLSDARKAMREGRAVVGRKRHG